MLRLQIATGIVIVLVLATDLAYSGFNRRQELVSWIDLVLVAFIVFVIFIDQIYNFTIGAKGIVFERRVAAVPRLQTATAGQKLAELDAVLQDFSGQEKDIWSRMILYLRALLRRVCSEKKALALKETTPMAPFSSRGELVLRHRKRRLQKSKALLRGFSKKLAKIG